MNPSCRLAGKVARVLLMGAFLVSILGAQVSETRPFVGFPEDWTHHRIKFTIPGLRQHPEIASREVRAVHQLYRMWEPYRRPLLAPTIANHSDWSMSLGTGTLADGQFPAKWTTDPTATPSCTADYVVFGLNASVAKTGGQATLVGFNNLYSGAAGALCPGGAPQVMFSYWTALHGGRILTSPTLSLKGDKIAFVESTTSQTRLHVLTIGTTGNNGTLVTAAVTPGSGNNAAMTDNVIEFGSNNTRSSPWVDYASDSLYVAADNGNLYKFTGAFNGNPTLVVGGGWPIAVAPAGTQLTGPVLDNTTGLLYIGGSNGILYAVNVNSPTTAPQRLTVGKAPAGGTNPGIYDSPSYDATLNNVIVITPDGPNVAKTGFGAEVVQATTTTTAPAITELAQIDIGRGASTGTNIILYDGDFNNNYFNDPLTGHMYVCGTGKADAVPSRYALDFGFNYQLFNDNPVGIATGVSGAGCSPFTDYFNPNINAASGGTDFVMYGVSSCRGALGGGCVYSIQQVGVALATQVTVAASGGTSGIVIDNDYYVTGTEQTSSFYFSTRTRTGPEVPSAFHAVKLTQLKLN